MLTKEEQKEIMTENGKHGWGYTKDEVLKYIQSYKEGDAHQRELIEFRLEDVNYHTIVNCLIKEDYQGAVEFVNREWE